MQKSIISSGDQRALLDAIRGVFDESEVSGYQKFYKYYPVFAEIQD
jgi:hypothetical protein